MKRVLFFSILFAVGTLHAQDILKKYGYNKEPLTLSKGRYKETFINENVMQIGTVLIDTRTYKVVKFLEEDATEVSYKAENTSRFLTMDPLAEKYPQQSPYVYCANNPVNNIDPTGLDWFTDKDGTYQFDPNIKSQENLQKGQTYVGATYQVKDENGNVTEDYRDDGSIMFSNESNGYARMWNNTQKTGNEEMGVITNNGVLVLPSWNNGPKDAKVEEYGYSFEKGKLVDPVTEKGMSFSGTAHTHPTLEKTEKGIINHSWMGPSAEDYDYFREHTPNTPFYVISADGVVHGKIPRVPDGSNPVNFGGKKRYIEDIVFGNYSLKNRRK